MNALNAKLVVGLMALSGVAWYLHAPAIGRAQTPVLVEREIRPAKWVGISEIRKRLNETTIDMKTLWEAPRTLGEVLEKVKAALAEKGQPLQFLIDQEAFTKENPDVPEILKTQVQFQPFPKKMSASSVLFMALSQVDTRNAEIVARFGKVYITTEAKARAIHYLKSDLNGVNFSKRPLAAALDELAEWTGANIVIDSKVRRKAQTRVTGQFGAKLDTAVGLLTDMAGLKHVVVDNVIYVTSPANARQFKETQRPLAGLHYRIAMKNRPLADYFKEFTVVVDVRVQKKTRIRVTAKFVHEVKLETMILLLSDMAGLKHVVVDNVIYVTSPANARILEMEQAKKKSEKK